MKNQITITDFRLWDSCYTREGREYVLFALYPSGSASPMEIATNEAMCTTYDRVIRKRLIDCAARLEAL